jgi:hypothetical protein
MTSRWQHKFFALAMGSCAAFLALSAAAMLVYPGGTMHLLTAANAMLQATGQKVIVYAAIVMVFVQAREMLRKSFNDQMPKGG